MKFFVVEKQPGTVRGEMPCLYHEEIPLSVRPGILWGMRLPVEADAMPLSVLYVRYREMKELGALPPSNLSSGDFYARK